jgi:hypothetical protein
MVMWCLPKSPSRSTNEDVGKAILEMQEAELETTLNAIAWGLEESSFGG